MVLGKQKAGGFHALEDDAAAGGSGAGAEEEEEVEVPLDSMDDISLGR